MLPVARLMMSEVEEVLFAASMAAISPLTSPASTIYVGVPPGAAMPHPTSTTTSSVAVRVSLSVTVSVMVWMPRPSSSCGLTPVAISSPSSVHT